MNPPLPDQVEQAARRSPLLYSARVVAWAGLGYGALAGATFLLAAALVASGIGVVVLARAGEWPYVLFCLAAAIPLLAANLVFSHALWVEVPEPEGRALSAAAHPELFRVLAEVAGQLGVPPPTRVVLTADLDVSVAVRPALGLLPIFRRTLVVGLPLLHALPSDEARALVTHELAHFAGRHARLSGLVYALRAAWSGSWRGLSARGLGSRGLARFLAWYVPRFDAISLPLARRDEELADRLAAAACTARTLVDALSRLAIARDALERFKADSLREAVLEPEPPLDLGTRSARSLLGAAGSDQAARALTRAQCSPPAPGDAHPGLAERASAVGTAVRMPPPASTSAAQAWLGPEQDGLAGLLSASWADELRCDWMEINLLAPTWRARQVEVDRALAGGRLSPELVAERAELVGHLGTPDEALAAWRAAMGLDPRSGRAHYEVGSRLLECGEEEGLDRLLRAVELEPTLLDATTQRAGHYLLGLGRTEDHRAWLGRAHQAAATALAVLDERLHVTSSDQLLPHDLKPATIDKVRAHLRETPNLMGAWVTRRQLRRSGTVQYLLGVDLAAPTDALSSLPPDDVRAAHLAALGEYFDVPGDWRIVPLHDEPTLERRMRAVDDSTVEV